MKNPPLKDGQHPRQAAGQGLVPDWSIRSIGAYPPKTGKAASVWFRAVVTGLFAALFVLVAGCSRTPPEEALRATIASMEAAAEGRDAEALVEAFAEDFAGPGNMDRDQFRRYVALVWLRNREVGVTLGPLDVELVGERARVEFTAATAGGDGFLPDSAQVYRVRTGWRLDDGEWRLISAEWEEAL